MAAQSLYRRFLPATVYLLLLTGLSLFFRHHQEGHVSESAALDCRRAGLDCYARGDSRTALAHCRQALTLVTRKRFPQTWALLQYDLAKASHELGLRTETEEGNQFLLDAVEAYRKASEVRTRIKMPQHWAETQSSIGAALMERDQRGAEQGGYALLFFADRAFQDALEIYSYNRKDRPWDAAAAAQWAKAQHDLGKALSRFGGRVENSKNSPHAHHLQERAVAAFRAALEVYTREALPQEWAMTQHHLGGALRKLARNGRWENRKKLREEAAIAYRMALEVRTREALPEQWAETQHSLANDAIQELYEDQVDWERRKRLWEEAFSAYRAALEVRTRDALPRQWLETQSALGVALENHHLWQEAERAYLAVLEVGMEQMPYSYHQRTINALRRVRGKLKQGTDDREMSPNCK